MGSRAEAGVRLVPEGLAIGDEVVPLWAASVHYWHLDPDEVRLVEAAIEVCDGRPSYVETHQSEFPTYCPWGARVISER